ncbi:hypothetical protein CDD81_3615 [Ophiocordyceps australis]|uniref:Telomeric single stranded DNA binding POT1/Cdc13 domain-containing protein n=1 Tax=Ophiocordyceps australis TaxID=1399860 RepID=A0A2C5XJK8_9HYPO|nr:hypothetical protein CDD81_3615 [Ophiocordyceps australis]
MMLATAKKGGPKDPSILLAKLAMENEAASPGQAEAVKESISPQGTLTASRRRWSNDPSILLAKTDGAESSFTENTPLTPRVTRSMVSQADAAMTSPSIGSMSDNEEVAMLQKELQAIHQTNLADYVLLRSLRSRHLLKKTVDVMGVCTHTPPQPHRPKHGPRDYMLELVLTDFSGSSPSVSVAHIFRPHMASLPVVHAGDVVLLRQMEVVSLKGRGCGVKDKDTSAWAVFEKDDKEMLAQIKGPPVEVTQAEVDYARLLRRRWTMQDDGARARVDKATHKAIEAGKDDSK